ncbi:MAG: DUF3617 family protein [Spirochaetales bacterium]|jgi:hypothetical protein|nr:DUF3617 family protein [Spirochaetales bacterium]
MKKILGSVLVVAGLLLSGCSDSGPDLREGKWQVTAQVEMAGVPFQMPPMIYEECLTQQDIIPRNDGAEQEGNCKIDGPKVEGNTVSWINICNNPDGSIATSKGSVTYAGEHFTGTMSMQITGEMPMTAENTLSGKYIGDCDK